MSETSQSAFFAGALVFVFIYFLASVITGLIGYGLASSKGRGGLGFVLGFFFSLIGLIIAALLEPSQKELRRRQLTGAGVQPAPYSPQPIPGTGSPQAAAPGYCANCQQPLRDALCGHCGYMNGEAST